MKQFEICFLIVSILLISSASAMEWDNVYTYDEKTKEATITNALGFGSDLAKIKLVENTDTCGSYCYAILEYTIYDDVTLPEDFSGTFGYEFEGDIVDYDLELESAGKYSKWDYKSKVLKDGQTYRIKLVGTKNQYEDVEWIPDFIGIKVTEWAWWYGMSEAVWYKFENDATDSGALGYNGNLSLTAGYTDRAKTGSYAMNLTNKSAYVNFDGVNLSMVNWSFCYWGYFENDNVGMPIITQDTGASGFEWVFETWASNTWEFKVYKNTAATSHKFQAGDIQKNRWIHTCLSFNQSDNNLSIYINGTIQNSSAAALNLGGTTTEDIYIGVDADNVGATGVFNGSIDDFRLWVNYTLTLGDVEWIYNNRAGIDKSLGSRVIFTTLYAPSNNINTTSTSVSFNCSGDDNALIENITLYLDGVANYTVVDGVDNFTELAKTVTNVPLGPHNWSCRSWDNETNSAWAASNRTFDVKDWAENSFSLNTTSYETKNEYFTINLSYDTGLYTSALANLWYNGTAYLGTKTGTGQNISFTKSLDVPKVAAKRNHSAYWQMSFTNSTGTFKRNSTKYNQSTDKIVLGLCNTTIKLDYANFTFKDEATNTAINASIDSSSWSYWIDAAILNKSYSYVNLTNHSSYAFCFAPNDTAINIDLTLQYSLGTYPQRRYSVARGLTNVSWNKVLYLLGTGDGSYSTFQVQTTGGTPIPGVAVSVQREIASVWTTISEGVTGDDGAVTFWLNPDYDHRFTFVQSGYDTVTRTIRPTQSLYTIVLGGSLANITYVSTIEGLKWEIRPNPGPLKINTEYTFWFNLTASKNNLASYSMNISNASGTEFASVRGTASSGSNLSVTMNTGTNSTLYGSLYADVGNGTFLIDPVIWTNLNITMGNLSVYAFLLNLKSSELMQDDEMQFTTLFFIFLIGFLLIAGFTRFTGVELQNPGLTLFLVFLAILVLSFGDFFNFTYGQNSLPFINKYGVALVSGLLALGYIFGRVAEGR